MVCDFRVVLLVDNFLMDIRIIELFGSDWVYIGSDLLWIVVFEVGKVLYFFYLVF